MTERRRTIQWLRRRRRGAAEPPAAAEPPPEPAPAEADAPPLPEEEGLAAEPEVEAAELALPEEEAESETGMELGEAEAAASPAVDALRQLARALVPVLRAAQARKPAALQEVIAAVRRLVELAQDEDAFGALELWLAEHEAALRALDEHVGDLVVKSANTLVYALKVARVLEMPEAMRTKLVLAAALHTVALARIPEEVRNKPSALEDKERELVARTWSEGAAWLKQSGLADAEVLRAIEEVPERLDGSGPKGLSGNEISTLGRILGLLSMFEALIHYRPWRKRLLPRDAVAAIIKEHKRRFEHAHLKALIESVSLYPPGTWVRLNSGEIAEVVRTHLHHPLRPVVEVRYAKSGEPVVPRRVDLLEMPNLRIEACMYPEELPHARSQRQAER